MNEFDTAYHTYMDRLNDLVKLESWNQEAVNQTVCDLIRNWLGENTYSTVSYLVEPSDKSHENLIRALFAKLGQEHICYSEKHSLELFLKYLPNMLREHMNKSVSAVI